MGDSSASDEVLGSPPDDQRCNKKDGKLWRCGSWKMQGKSLCQMHFLKQAEYKTKKKTAPAQQQHKGKRKTPCPGDGLEEKNNTNNNKKNMQLRSMSGEDDSITKLFEDNYATSEDDDSIEKLFEDNYPTGSDDDSCSLVTRPGSKVKKVSHAKDEDVEELQKAHAESTTRS